MSDGRLLDSISRILASPMPRRQAVKLIAGGFGAAAVAFLGGKKAHAGGEGQEGHDKDDHDKNDHDRDDHGRCKKNEITCGRNCCPPGHECTKPDICCPRGQVCGPDLCCPTGSTCVTEGNNRKRCKAGNPSKSK